MWFFSKVPSHLPKARGKYVPGVFDVMTEYSKCGLLLRLYYPTAESISIESNYEKWPSTMPDYDYIAGLANVAMLPEFIMNMVWLKSGKTSIPSLYGAKVATGEKLKCIVFSHGLGALRSFYSAICVELASRGYLVAVIEHRDESACHTYYYNSQEDAQANKKTSINFKKVQLGKGHHEVREQQVTQRTEEMCRALDLFINLNNGTVPHNVLNDVGRNGETMFNLEELVGKIDVENLMVGGHSFGGATAMRTLSLRKEAKLGIILDPWMYPVKNFQLETKITQPLLFINTHTFHIETNVNAMGLYLDNEKKRQMYTILKSTHENQTDSVFIAGYWLNWFMKKIDPIRALNINNGLILRFLKDFTGHSEYIKDAENCLRDNEKHFGIGLTKPWA